MAQVNDQLISDLARKALKGDQNSYHLLMKILNELDHHVLDEIDRRVVGIGVLEAVLLPISTLIRDNPRPRISSQSVAWETGSGRPHSLDGPAELWFGQEYIAYAINGLRHREDGPAVIDVSNESVSFFLKGKPRTHDRGPFRVERHEGHIMLTYVLSERMMNKRPPGTALHHDGLSGWNDEELDEPSYSEEPGDHVVVTHDYIEIEGVGKSAPREEDIRNLNTWNKNFEVILREGHRYLEDYLNKFR